MVQIRLFRNFNLADGGIRSDLLLLVLTSVRVRSEFFSERVIAVWNELSLSTDFSTITRFKGSILDADFSGYLVCF